MCTINNNVAILFSLSSYGLRKDVHIYSIYYQHFRKQGFYIYLKRVYIYTNNVFENKGLLYITNVTVVYI